jgi:hypothetical protein
MNMMRNAVFSFRRLWLPLLLTVLLFTFCFGAAAYAEQSGNCDPEETSVTVKGGKYELDADKTHAVFTGAAKKSVTELVIQDKVKIGDKKYKVTVIKEGACSGLKKLKTLTIGAYVKTIEKDAFEDCTALKTVEGGAAVQTIGNEAFEDCKALKSFTLGAKVKKIGDEVFNRCKKLATLIIKSEVLKSIGKDAFGHGPDCVTVTVPKDCASAYKKLLKKAGMTGKIILKKK